MTKRPVRDVNDGTYHINGKKFPELIGSRTQVHNKTAYKTPGGLTISNLMMNKWGRIVSVLKHKTAKKEKRLEKAGYFAKKGKFGYVKKSAKNGRKTAKKGSRKMRGGYSKSQITADCTKFAPGNVDECVNEEIAEKTAAGEKDEDIVETPSTVVENA